MYKRLNHKNTKYKPNKLDELYIVILKAFNEIKKIYGRERLSIFIKNKYQININYRALGRIINKLSLKFNIRKKCKSREIKNVDVKFNNLVNRDYNGTNNEIAIATDVSYIPSPKNIQNNFVYFSACIDHKTKKIINWNLSNRNDINLVLEHIKEIKPIENALFTPITVSNIHQKITSKLLTKIMKLYQYVELAIH
ncbi:hypothetical protein [Mycoplasma hafezii]|uniref:hypothetical protein n=1 Tax=Mycoplasma hafezii TaxID=525886 RepID=UPI003CF1BCA7